MNIDWLKRISIAISGLAIFIVLQAIVIEFSRPAEIHIPKPIAKQTPLPSGAYTLASKEYEEIGAPLIKLKETKIDLKLPDLRQIVKYLGINNRPDAINNEKELLFSTAYSDTIKSVKPGENLYLSYHKANNKEFYEFTPDNIKSSLWIRGFPQGSESVLALVFLINQDGLLINKPNELKEFVLKQTPNTDLKNWKLGNLNVTQNYLKDLGFEWLGKDQFLQKHGGIEYQKEANNEKFTFGNGDNSQSIAVNPKDILIFNNNKWEKAKPDTDTQKYPILTINTIDEGTISLKLWDIEGKRSILFTIPKSTHQIIATPIEKEFKFGGSRTKSRITLKTDNSNLIVTSKDWVVNIDGIWKKLESPEMVKNYVDGKIKGPLMVINDIDAQNDKTILNITLYSKTRTDSEDLSFNLERGEYLSKITVDKSTKSSSKKTLTSSQILPSERSSELRKFASNELMQPGQTVEFKIPTPEEREKFKIELENDDTLTEEQKSDYLKRIEDFANIPFENKESITITTPSEEEINRIKEEIEKMKDLEL